MLHTIAIASPECRQLPLQTNSLVPLHCSSQLLFCLKTVMNADAEELHQAKPLLIWLRRLGRYRGDNRFLFSIEKKQQNNRLPLTRATGSYFATPPTAFAPSTRRLRLMGAFRRHAGFFEVSRTYRPFGLVHFKKAPAPKVTN